MMESFWYVVSFDLIGKWFLIGLMSGFLLRRIAWKIPPVELHLKAFIFFAITMSILLLLLLIEGFDVTVIAILSFGFGLVMYLCITALSRELQKFFSPTKKGKSIHLHS